MANGVTRKIGLGELKVDKATADPMAPSGPIREVNETSKAWVDVGSLFFVGSGLS